MGRISFFGSLILSILVSLSFYGCDDSSNTSVLPAYSGRIGELVVVSTDRQWDGSLGEAVRDVFNETQYGLPQSEPYFTTIHTTEDNFMTIFKTYRNVFVISVDTNHMSQAKLLMKKDVYARGQHWIEAKGSTEEEIIELLSREKQNLIDHFNKTELNRLYRRNKQYADRDVLNKVEAKYGFTFAPKKGGVVALEEANATWIRWEGEKLKGGFKHQISQGMLVYFYPYIDEAQFADSNLLEHRDLMLKKYIPGPSDNSYMTTEYRYVDPQFTEMSFNGQFAKEIRGLWRMENNFMGGPMITLATYDEANQRIVVINGYVFAPQFDKREHLREVEAMMKSITFLNQQKTEAVITTPASDSL